MHELKVKLFETEDDTVLLTVSTDLSQLPAWRMCIEGLEGLPGVEKVRTGRYHVELSFANWITTVESLAEAISEEFFAGPIVDQLLAQTTVPVVSVTYTDNIRTDSRRWELHDGHKLH